MCMALSPNGFACAQGTPKPQSQKRIPEFLGAPCHSFDGMKFEKAALWFFLIGGSGTSTPFGAIPKRQPAEPSTTLDPNHFGGQRNQDTCEIPTPLKVGLGGG